MPDDSERPSGRKVALPRPPREAPRQADLSLAAPAVQRAVTAVLADLAAAGEPGIVWEVMRTTERQRYLYGFGRDYDDGRGIVTRAASHLYTWHGYGLAVDVVHATLRHRPPPSWWRLLGAAAARHGLRWGGTFSFFDGPHVQWGRCRVSPSAHARALYAGEGLRGVWRAVGAD